MSDGPRTLLVSPALPRQARGGGAMRGLQMLDSLARLGPVGVFALARESLEPQDARASLWRTSSVDGLTGTAFWTPDLLDWLRRPAGHPSDNWFSPVAAEELMRTVDELQPDVVVVDHLWLHRYIGLLSESGARIVLNTHNVEGRVQDDIVADRTGALFTLLRERTSLVEAHAVRAVDEVWACSDLDAAAFRSLYPDCAPVRVVPNAVDVPAYPAATHDGRSVVYTGSFAYPPNEVAAMHLVESVLPLLREVAPDVTLALVGVDPAAAMLAAAERDPGVRVTGAVPDVRPYLAAASVMAVPLFDGGGTRFKIVEAFAAGLPVVSTAKGVEGLDAVAGEHYLRAETPEEFREAITQVWTDGSARDRAARARRLAAERYSWEAAGATVRESVERLAAYS